MIRKSFLSAVILVTAFCFTACGKPQTTNEIVTTSTTDTQVQTTPDALSTTEVEVTEQEIVEPEEVTLEDWVQKVNTNNSSENIVFTVYNENSKSGTLLDVTQGEINELGENVITAEYTLQEGDALVVCLPNHIPGTTEFVYSSMNGISSRGFGENYKIFDIQSGDVKFGISYMDMDYHINLTIN